MTTKSNEKKITTTKKTNKPIGWLHRISFHAARKKLLFLVKIRGSLSDLFKSTNKLIT